MKAEDLYHSGIVVDDFGAVLAWLSDVAGYRWCDELSFEQLIWTPTGERSVSIRFTYSMNEPRLEIIEAVQDTIWIPSPSGVHHLGYWSDDVDRDIETFLSKGLRVEAKAPMPDGSTMWGYCRGDSGPRIELVTRSLEPMLSGWFTTGRSPFG